MKRSVVLQILKRHLCWYTEVYLFYCGEFSFPELWSTKSNFLSFSELGSLYPQLNKNFVLCLSLLNFLHWSQDTDSEQYGDVTIGFILLIFLLWATTVLHHLLFNVFKPLLSDFVFSLPSCLRQKGQSGPCYYTLARNVSLYLP